MVSHSFNLSNDSFANRLVWWSLAFQAGVINVGGFLACHRFVTHTTGFATHFGAEVAQFHWSNAAGMVSVPLFFMAGAYSSGLMIERKIRTGQKPRYLFVLSTIILFLLLVVVGGISGQFGEFGHPLDITSDYTLLALLCLVSGMQNAAVTSASGAVLRTTHLTGITTDLGIGLALATSPSCSKEVRTNEMRKNLIRIGLISGFVFGSAFGAFLFVNFGYWGFLVPLLNAGGLLLLAHRSKLQIS